MYKFFKIVLLSLLFLSGKTFAILELRLTEGASNAMPIVVAPFSGQEKLFGATKVADVISNDLKNSGRFSLINGYANFSSVNYIALQAKKIEAVAVGQIEAIDAKRVLVKFKLLDVYTKSKLFEKSYKVEKTRLRKLAHHISDVIYQKITGDRGVFSTKIAYVLVERKGRLVKYKLQVADSDGRNNHTLLTSSYPLMSPSWSPDGKRIAYVSFEGYRAAIYIQNITTGKRRILTKLPGINGAPSWSPDGKKMALVLTKTGYPKIHVFNLATKRISQLTTGYSLDTEPSWAPDGKSLIFTSNKGGNPQIYRVYLGNKKVERVSFDGKYNARASFLPNGKDIVLLHKTDGMFTIAVENLKSRRITLLTRAGFNESPSVAPNGKMVVYATNRNGKGMLAEVSIDGKVKLMLPAGNGEVQEPAWSPFLK